MQNITANPTQVILRNYEASITIASTEYTFGLISEVKITFKPINAERDSKGRSFTAGYDAKFEFNIMQITDANIDTLLTAVNSDDVGTVKLKKGVNGLQLTDVKPVYDFELDGAGGVSKIKVSMDKIMSKDEMTGITY